LGQMIQNGKESVREEAAQDPFPDDFPMVSPLLRAQTEPPVVLSPREPVTLIRLALRGWSGPKRNFFRRTVHQSRLQREVSPLQRHATRGVTCAGALSV
jgi:hypothetical protein